MAGRHRYAKIHVTLRHDSPGSAIRISRHGSGSVWPLCMNSPTEGTNVTAELYPVLSLPDELAQYCQLALWQSRRCYETGYRTVYWKDMYCT
jgi:hypothetical protein